MPGLLVAWSQNNKVGTKGRAKNILHDRWWWQKMACSALLFITPYASEPQSVLLLAAFGLLASLLSVARSAVEGATSAICW